MNGARLSAALRALGIYSRRPGLGATWFNYPDPGGAAPRWTLRPDGANWEFPGDTMDACIDAFVERMRDVSAEQVGRARASLDAAVAMAALIDEALAS